MMLRILPFFLLCVLLSSCSLIYRGVLGIDTTPQWMDSTAVIKALKKRELTNDINLILDTASFTNAVKIDFNEELDLFNESENTKSDSMAMKLRSNVANDDLQPTQIRMFSSDGKEVFKIVNCYIDPPIPMDWNIKGCFNQFPPFIDEKDLNTQQYDLGFFLSHSRQLDSSTYLLSELPKSDYYLVVLWNSFMVKPSKKAIETVKEYLVRHSEKLIIPIYINNHNSSVWSLMDEEQRERVREYYREMKET